MIRIDHLLIQDFDRLKKPKLKALMLEAGLLSDDKSEDDEDMNSPTALVTTEGVEPKKRRFARGVLNPPRSEPSSSGRAPVSLQRAMQEGGPIPMPVPVIKSTQAMSDMKDIYEVHTILASTG